MPIQNSKMNRKVFFRNTLILPKFHKKDSLKAEKDHQVTSQTSNHTSNSFGEHFLWSTLVFIIGVKATKIIDTFDL